LIVTCRKCKVSYHLDDSLIKEKGSKVRCSNCKHIFRVFPARISRNAEKPAVGAVTSYFAQISTQKPEGNTNTDSQHEDHACDFCEPISREELNYIEERAATIISGREAYSWNIDLADFPRGDIQEHSEITAEYPDSQGEKSERIESEIGIAEDLSSDLATEPFDALLQLLGLDRKTHTNLPEDDETDGSESHDQDLWLHESFPQFEYDWRDFDYEPDDFDVEISNKGFSVCDTDGVTRSERATHIAIELGDNYGWDKEGIKLLAGILEEHGWSAAKKALELELQNGVKPEELDVASAIREIWNENPEFSTGLSYWGSHGDRSVSFSHRYLHLSWPAALALVRCFESYPDPAEIEELFLELYNRWISNLSFQGHFSSFYSYLRYHFGLVSGSLDIMPGLVFKDDNSFSNELHPGCSESQTLISYFSSLNY